jgi:beta-glucosidase
MSVSTMPLPSIPIPDFPPSFVWGVATSAYQIEGAASHDGKGPSIWDRFCEQAGAIEDGTRGDVACDHYHRSEADLDLVAALGVDAYRFSVSWPRVSPLGDGRWNEAGLAFYDRLVDGLVRRGIRPHLTLNHWDLPQALQDKGGWAHRETVHRFVEYAQCIAQRLGDRVEAITTHNEPWVIATLGHEQGIFAPGLRSRATAMQVSHHLLLSHGMALSALRAQGCKARLGIVLNLSPVYPVSPTPQDVAKASLYDGYLLRWYMDALSHGHYPQDVWADLGADAPVIEPGDMAHVCQPLDFLGVNYYTRSMVQAEGRWDNTQSGLPLTDMGWEVYPQGLTDLLARLHQDYALPPIYITENGCACADEVQDGRVHDPERVAYLQSHIAAVHDALQRGVPVAGYMVWSLLDNFEWASGFAKRFGIVHVNYDTQARTLKDSALWYQRWASQQRTAKRVAAHGSIA